MWLTEIVVLLKNYGIIQIQKIECSNYLYRNFVNQLRETTTSKRSLSKNVAVISHLRKIVLERYYPCVSGVKKGVQ